jgi:hypothetical protein
MRQEAGTFYWQERWRTRAGRAGRLLKRMKGILILELSPSDLGLEEKKARGNFKTEGMVY